MEPINQRFDPLAPDQYRAIGVILVKANSMIRQIKYYNEKLQGTRRDQGPPTSSAAEIVQLFSTLIESTTIPPDEVANIRGASQRAVTIRQLVVGACWTTTGGDGRVGMVTDWIESDDSRGVLQIMTAEDLEQLAEFVDRTAELVMSLRWVLLGN